MAHPLVPYLDDRIAIVGRSGYGKSNAAKGAVELPLAAGLGTAVVGIPKRATEIYSGTIDSDRLDHQTWGWPLTDIEHFEPIVPRKGLQGFWTWDA